MREKGEFGKQAVACAVLAGRGLTFPGARTGARLSVVLIGCCLRCGYHCDLSMSGEDGRPGRKVRPKWDKGLRVKGRRILKKDVTLPGSVLKWQSCAGSKLSSWSSPSVFATAFVAEK